MADDDRKSNSCCKSSSKPVQCTKTQTKHACNPMACRKVLEEEIRAQSKDYDDRSDYIEAININPKLAEESFYNSFMHFHNFQIKEAAVGLEKYWKERKLLFNNRAYLSIFDQSGNGCLSLDDISFLNNGDALIHLPDASNMSSCIMFDYTRLRNLDWNNVKHSYRRTAFYLIATCGFINPRSHTDGINFLYLINYTDFDDIQHEQLRSTLSTLEYLPIKIHRLHLCFLAQPELRPKYENELIPKYVECINSTAPDTPIVTHVEEDMEAMIRVLETFGVNANSQTHSNSSNRGRAENTDDHCIDSDGTDTSSDLVSLGYGLDQTSGSSSNQRRDDSKSSQASSEVIAQRQSRKRMMDTIYARQRRERKKSEQSELQIQYSNLHQINMVLKGENMRLQALVTDAHATIEQLPVAHPVHHPINGCAVAHPGPYTYLDNHRRINPILPQEALQHQLMWGSDSQRLGFDPTRNPLMTNVLRYPVPPVMLTHENNMQAQRSGPHWSGPHASPMHQRTLAESQHPPHVGYSPFTHQPGVFSLSHPAQPRTVEEMAISQPGAFFAAGPPNNPPMRKNDLNRHS